MELRHENQKAATVVELLLETSKAIVSELELEKVVQRVTDVATNLSGAKFGAFFYNAENEAGEIYQLYTISGVPKEAFSRFPMPRNTKVFGPTFDGLGTVRYDDVTQQPHYGQNPPHRGMPEGHLPVRSYLAVPVISLDTREVIGGLFFGHPDPDVFTEDAEKLVEGIAAQAAIAMENARLYEVQKRITRQLRLSEERFRLMADNVPVMIWITDEHGHCTYLNKQWYNYTGQTEATGLGLGWLDAVHPEDAPRSGAIFLNASHRQEAFSLIYRLRDKEGHYRWMIDSGNPKFTSEGRHEGFTGTVVDIHEQKLAEDQLKKQNILIKTITDNTKQALFMMDARQVCTFMNPAAEQMTGFRLHEVQHQPLHYYVHHTYPDGRPFPLEECQIDRALPTKAQTQGEDVFVHRNGSFYPVAFTASPIIEDGVPAGTVIEARNITQEKARQVTLRTSEERLRLAVEATSLGTWDFNPQTGALDWSARCKELFGLPAEVEVDYEVFLRSLHPEDRDRTHAAVQDSLDPRGDTKFDIEYRTIGIEDGRERWIHATGECFFDQQARPVRFIGTVQDITAQKISQHTLEEKSRDLEYANEDLKNFTYTISHDIKGPLSNLLLATQLAEGMDSVEEIRPLLAMIAQSGHRMSDILQGLVQIIREEETKGKVEPIEVPQLIEEIKLELRESLQAAEAAVITDIQSTQVHFIRSYLQSILRNLLDNAIKYRAPGSQPVIHVSVHHDGQATILSVRDNGLGIDLTRHGRDLFQPFRRFSDEQPGTGIGLFMIRRMIEKHGGRIEVQSAPGRGSTFRVTIPGVAASARS